MKDAGGIHNTTLKIGPPAQFMQAGRYICLVNNPEGHAHKEIFVRVLTDQQIQSSIQSKYLFEKLLTTLKSWFNESRFNEILPRFSEQMLASLNYFS